MSGECMNKELDYFIKKKKNLLYVLMWNRQKANVQVNTGRA